MLILFFEVLDEEENHDAVVFLTEIDYQSNLILVSSVNEARRLWGCFNLHYLCCRCCFVSCKLNDYFLTEGMDVHAKGQ